MALVIEGPSGLFGEMGWDDYATYLHNAAADDKPTNGMYDPENDSNFIDTANPSAAIVKDFTI